jgi:dihydrofolate synthase/folylpolyglutamate synthase
VELGVTPAASVQYLQSLGAEMRPGRKFDLAEIGVLLEALGQPQRAFPSVHIAGTNGKGSTAAFIAAALRAAGHRTGLYTSPHLQRLNERIRFLSAGARLTPPAAPCTTAAGDIEDAALARAATQVRDASEALLAQGRLPHPPSFFEVMTAIGFLAFAAAGIDWAVVEVGLGGRLDATNILQPPQVKLAVITPIGMDHEAYLGSTLTAIAGEKAGIIKPGLEAVLTAVQAPEAMAVLERHAAAAGVPLLVVEPPLELAPGLEGRFRPTVTYLGAALELAPPLRGRHQAENATLAAQACALLGVPASAVQAGIAQTYWPGRLEKIGKIGEHPEVFVDGAHNPLAARVLAAFLDERAAADPAAPAPILIYGSMRDKAVDEICELLFPRARAVVLTAPDQPRALAPQALARACGPLAAQFEIAAGYPAALAAARRLSRQMSGGAAPIFVTGSLYLVGEAREYARQQGVLWV